MQTILRNDVKTFKRDYSWTVLHSAEGTGLFRRLSKIIIDNLKIQEDFVQFVCKDGEVLYERNKWGGYQMKEILFNWTYNPLIHVGLEHLSETLLTYVRFNNGEIDGEKSVMVWCGEVLVLEMDHKKGVRING